MLLRELAALCDEVGVVCPYYAHRSVLDRTFRYKPSSCSALRLIVGEALQVLFVLIVST
jgi:hypothetical protein